MVFHQTEEEWGVPNLPGLLTCVFDLGDKEVHFASYPFPEKKLSLLLSFLPKLKDEGSDSGRKTRRPLCPAWV